MNKQHGFSLVAVFLILVVIGVVGFAGYYVLGQYNEPKNVATTELPEAKSNEETTSENDSENKASSEDDSSIFINDVEIGLVAVKDLERLPDYTPKGFIELMRETLENNTVDSNDPCLQSEFSISQISPYNIVGGSGPVEAENNELCFGGAPIIWIKNPDGSWIRESRNSIVCQTKQGGLVYEEFATECNLNDEWIKNPNGSIFNTNS